MASSVVGAMHAVFCLDTVISDRLRPEPVAVLVQRVELALSISWSPQMMFDSSAYCATIRSVFFSPPPPIITGILDTGGGSLIASVTS